MAKGDVNQADKTVFGMPVSSYLSHTNGKARLSDVALSMESVEIGL